MNARNNKWLEERREEYIRDAIEGFLKAYLVFKAIYRDFKREGKVEFSRFVWWVGTEEGKGDLWKLKDILHSLLDYPQKSTSHELAFERAVHLIFHQFMSFKEHTYVLEQYQRTSEKKYFHRDRRLTEALRGFESLMEGIKEELPREIESCKQLFENSLELLKSILPRYSKNQLLVKYLVENPGIINGVYGREGWEEIMNLMFPGSKEEAYCTISTWYFENGYYREAKKYIDKAVATNPSNKKVKKLRQRIKKYVG